MPSTSRIASAANSSIRRRAPSGPAAARELLTSGSYDPDTLKIIYKAFDDAWSEIAANFGDNPIAIEAARLKRANIILNLPQGVLQ